MSKYDDWASELEEEILNENEEKNNECQKPQKMDLEDFLLMQQASY
jgi:hypothetical protein